MAKVESNRNDLMNPYTTPKGCFTHAENLRGAISNFGLAFFYGCGASGLGTLVGALHYPWLHYWFLHQGVPRGYVYEAIMMSLTVNWIAQGVNTACGLLGGYLLASRVSSHTLLLGAITGLPLMIHAALPYLTYPRPNPWWAQLLSFLLPIPVGMLGIRLGQRRALPHPLQSN